jgi:hypothetical protein
MRTSGHELGYAPRDYISIAMSAACCLPAAGLQQSRRGAFYSHFTMTQAVWPLE